MRQPPQSRGAKGDEHASAKRVVVSGFGFGDFSHRLLGSRFGFEDLRSASGLKQLRFGVLRFKGCRLWAAADTTSQTLYVPLAAGPAPEMIEDP